MGIFRPNKLGYTSDDVEKKSNSYIMTLVEKFVTNITDIVDSFKKDVQDLNSGLFNLDGKYKNITDKIIDDLDTERLQREGVNTGHDKQISELYAKKADKIAVELKADKATTLSGYGITDAYNKTEVNDKLLAIDGRYKTAEYSDIDSLYEPCIYHIADNDKHNGWLLVTHYTEEYEDHHYGSMIGNVFCQLYFHENDNYEGVLEKRTGTNGRWTEWESIGSGAGAVSSVNGQVGDVELSAEDVGAYTKEEIGDMSHSHFFDGLTSAVLSNYFNIQSLGYDVYNTKADKASILITSESSLILTHNQEARLGEIATLTLSMPTAIDDLYWSSFCFASPASNATSISYSGEPIIWCGDDCDADGSFIPEANTKYEVHIKKLGSDIVARVGAY